MAWLFLLSLALGLLGCREYRRIWMEPQLARYRPSSWYLLVLSWFPALCWLFNLLFPQY